MQYSYCEVMRKSRRSDKMPLPTNPRVRMIATYAYFTADIKLALS